MIKKTYDVTLLYSWVMFPCQLLLLAISWIELDSLQMFPVTTATMKVIFFAKSHKNGTEIRDVKMFRNVKESDWNRFPRPKTGFK